jgi:Ca2+-binding EF-hand superfamily protein
VFLGMMKRKTIDVYHYLDLKDSFNHFDADKDGVLNQKDIQSALTYIFHTEATTPMVLLYLK